MRTNGINHLALVCRDMAETVAFYTEVLEMPLVKTVELPGGGQHFFFDCGGGNLLAFFWWENAPAAAPGVASVEDFPSEADERRRLDEPRGVHARRGRARGKHQAA